MSNDKRYDQILKEDTTLLKELIEKDFLSSYQIIYKEAEDGTIRPVLEPIKTEPIKKTTNILDTNITFEEYMKKNKETLRKNMKTFREMGNITQKQMADFCQLSKNHLSAIERGLHVCNMDCLLMYSYVLKKPISSFFQNEEETMISELSQLVTSMNEKEQIKLLKILKIYLS